MADKQAATPSERSGRRATVLTGPYSPLVQLLVLLPLVVFYEAAMPFISERTHAYHRIDAWSQAALSKLGLTAWYLPGALMLLGLLAIHVYRHDPWKVRADSLWKLWGESILWTVPLFVLYLLFTLPVGRLLGAGAALAMGGSEDLFAQIVLAVGSGLFEEFIYRLVLMSALLWLLQRLFRLSLDASQLLAVCLAAAVFAAALYVGPSHARYDHLAFLFRVGAGIYLGSVFILRGFATSTIVHATFNIALALLGMS